MEAQTALQVTGLARHWGEVEALAARHRLRLVQRYQAQHERLDDEVANLEIARAWLAQQTEIEVAQPVLAYLNSLAPYYKQRGLPKELLKWCEVGIRACPPYHPHLGQLRLLQSEAQYALGQWEEAMTSLQWVIQNRVDDDTHMLAQCWSALGRLQLNRGDYATSLITLRHAEELLLAHADYEAVAVVQMEIASYHLNRRELDRALGLYLQIDEFRKQHGATESSDQMLMMLGVTYRKLQDYPHAQYYLHQLLERGRQRHNHQAVAVASHHLAFVHLSQGELVLARQAGGQALALFNDMGDIRGLADAYEQLGLIALAEGQNASALSYLHQSLNIRRAIGNRHGATSCLQRLALIHWRSGHLLWAVYYLWQSLYLYARLGVLTGNRLTTMAKEFWTWTWRRQSDVM